MLQLGTALNKIIKAPLNFLPAFYTSSDLSNLITCSLSGQLLL